MEKSNHNFETPESCKIVIDNASKMSFETTEVLPNNNNNKEDSEIIDDSMVCDDDNIGVDVRKEENNQSITVELPPVAVTEEMPPKYDTCSEVISNFASPKSKKRKLPSFDELLENLHSNILVMNFTKLLLFLISNNKELTFPFTSKDYEKFFEMIVQDINILKSKSLDANYREICDKIIVAATSYLLTCAYEYKQEFQKIVMVIKKEHNNIMDQSENGTTSFDCSRESVMPSPQTSIEEDSNEVLSRSPSPGPITSDFIVHCLCTMLAFIKNDVTKTKEFPELNSEQAQFMHLLLESVVAFTVFDSNLEIKELYRALWEAVRIYSLKYEFKIKCVESCGGKKSLVFEKVPKNKPPVTAVNSNQLMNATTDVLKTEASKLETPKPEASKPEATKKEPPKPEPPKLEALKTEALIPEASELQASKPEDLKLEATIKEPPKLEPPKPVSSKTEALIPEASKSEASKPEASKSNPWYPMSEIPKLMPYVIEKSTRVTKRMLKRKLKIENENLFIKRLPAKLISDTLNTIHDFLLDENRLKLVFVPNTNSELDFYRKCLSWCRTSLPVSKFGDQFQEMHYQISRLLYRVKCTVNKGGSSKINETTGMKEVTYIKKRKNLPFVYIRDTAQSKEAFVRPSNQAWTDGSSSTCSSRGTSRDRSKATAQAQHVAKRALNEINQSAKNTFQETSRSWRGEEMIRKEQLIEALSVPVQSDKAMRMMRGMGWSGGALGARGNGITEPLMPTLDRARGAGFGHSTNAQTETTARKPRESKTAPSFVSENSNTITETDMTENDVIVQKTKQLLVENPNLDSIMEVMEPRKHKSCNVELPRQTNPLPTQTKTTVELPKPIKANVEPLKPTTSNPRGLKPLPTLTKFSIALQKPENSGLEFPLPFREEILHSILELLNSEASCKTLIYEKRIRKKDRRFVNTAVKVLKGSCNLSIFKKEEHDICRKIQEKFKKLPQFVFEGVVSIDLKTVELIKKVLPEFETPTQQELPIINQLPLKPNTEAILEKNIHTYIISSGTHFESLKAYYALKFKVLFLLNLLSFVKSSNEEVEVTFNKVLNSKQKTYIENVVDEVNMRIKFGSSPAETKLCAEIKNNIKDAFLGFMFNHQYTVVTLRKYFRFKRLNRPDNAVKRTCQTIVDLDAFSSETCSKANLITNEPTDQENNSKVAESNDKLSENNSKVAENHIKVAENNSKVAENNSAYGNNAISIPEESGSKKFEPYDSDNTSVEKYNNNNCSVPKLLPGEDGVNISNFLYLNDDEKPDTPGLKNNSNINTDSASKNNSNVTENRNKNNIGNGNVVIDNNDNQVIDMKRDCGYTKNTVKEKNIVDTEMAEYFICIDYTEEVVNNGEMTIDMNKEKEVNISENKKDGEVIDKPIKRFNIIVANDVVEIVNQHKEIGVDNMDKIIDEVLSNTENTIDQNVIVVEDSDSSDCTENIIKDEIQNGDNLSKNGKDIKEDTDVLMIEIDDEPMEVNSITEESIEENDKEESVELINQGELAEKNNKEEFVIIIDKAESSRDVEVAKMEEENSINSSDDQIMKGDLGVKSDSDIISKEKLVLSEDFCDTHSVGLSQLKTVDTVTDVPNFHINKDTEIKNVRIVHILHPIRQLTIENFKEIQRHISNSIVRTSQLPLLKCCGVQNGALIYSCHNKKTYDWLQNTITFASYVKVLNTKEVTKMALKIYCFFDFSTRDLFRMIELYNQELSTKDWVVEKTEKDGDYVIFIVRMDKFSIKFIQESDLALFAGIDKVQFSLIWE